MNLRLVVFICSSVFLLSCKRKNTCESTQLKNEVTIQQEVPQITKKEKKRLVNIAEDFEEEYLTDKNFNGMFLMAKHGQIIYEKYNGYCNYKKREKINPNTPLHVASISKTITAIAIMKLVEEGSISLDQMITDFFPELPYKDVTVRMLLNHRSGIQYYGYFSYHKQRWDFRKTLYNKGVLHMLTNFKLEQNYPTNKRFQYSNTNYALLASIIEKVKGKKFPKVMKEMIFEPLGMQNTFIFDYPKQLNEVSESYKSNYRIAPFDYLDGVYGDKNVYTTVRDLLKLDRATYNPLFLSNASRKEMFKPYSNEFKSTRNYGLGFRMVTLENGLTYYFHTGWWHGNTGCYLTLREEEITLIYLSNKYSQAPFKIGQMVPEILNK